MISRNIVVNDCPWRYHGLGVALSSETLLFVYRASGSQTGEAVHDLEANQ